MKLLVLDNYDSFTFNLVHIVERLLQQKVDVFRNDKITLEEVNIYDKIILSPGPGLPCESGILLDLIKKYAPSKSILGVCLGEQAIGEAFGGTLENLTDVFHGVATTCTQTNIKSSLFKGLDETFTIGRYHSWVVSDKNFPADQLEITTRDEHGFIMGLQHKVYDVQGVQFHPESVLTPNGETILKNWLSK
ncbi:anthranilate synthase component II [Arachidicoccus soli]|uniref:Aminodeoxychorismate/anthranilate synthase component II n=1 Tax=Arachidicoccus soli TaxID=2341117 RepID=A0A386HPR8_9BACT|nr:aminodeoxychorismate/anthranilate synthase component II [Arachidicoccus soli]AYD47264.1 aminodeoxychorismate/anthranilate synthase component II [Arachidicoccus soli]